MSESEDLYRILEPGEIIRVGDEVDNCADNWRDEPKWEPTICAGQVVPTRAPAHRVYRRLKSRDPAMPAARRAVACQWCGEYPDHVPMGLIGCQGKECGMAAKTVDHWNKLQSALAELEAALSERAQGAEC